MAILKFGENILSYGGDLLSLDHTPAPPEGGYWIHYLTLAVSPITLEEDYITDTGSQVQFAAPPYKTDIGEISIPEGVNRLMADSLSDAGEMTKLILPSTIDVLMDNCLSNTLKLVIIECRAIVPPSFNYLGQYVGDLGNLAVYVPAASLTDYQSAPGWEDFSSIIYPIP